MLDDDGDLLELLVLWWRAERQWSPVEGYPVECPSTRGWRSSRQYDDGNGAMETDARGALIRRIGAAVHSLGTPHSTRLYILARNRAEGTSTWTSPVMPQDPVEREWALVDALERLRKAL